MPAPDLLLRDLEALLSDSFRDAVVWEQKDADLIGRYLYVKYDGREVGIFVGYQIGRSGSVRAAITFFFTHRASALEDPKDIARVFHKLLIRLNLRLRANPYKRVSGKSPAIIRMKYFGEKDFSAQESGIFFKESINAMKNCEPLYKAPTL
jgi:hypothetical protein